MRLRWLQMHQGIEREHRVFDAILLGHISNSISYFGSGTLLVLAGLVSALANVNSVYLLTRSLAFVDQTMTLHLFTLCVFLLTAILAQCFFSFTYALRKMAYTFAMLGGLQATRADTPEARIMGEQSAVVLTEAVRSINTGIRGYYYAVAALFLFAGPYACIAATLDHHRAALLPPAVLAHGEGDCEICGCAEGREGVGRRRSPGRTSLAFNPAASAASFSIPAQSFASISFFGAIQEPPTVMTFGSFR